MQDDLVTPILATSLAFCLSLALLGALLLPATQRWLLDHPNARSLHVSPIPRTGGVALMLGIAAGLLVAGSARVPIVLAVALMLLSIVDDWRDLPAVVRLLGHLAAAFAFVHLTFTELSWPAMLLLTVGIAWMTNLYNFMDGSDGLAGGMALIGFSVYGLTAWSAGQHAFSLANFCVAVSAAAFLLFNFPPARIFMGDAGSIPLGFLAAALGLQGWHDGLWPLWFPLVVFGPFVVDASVTLARRLLRGEKVWQAHRAHYYQRIILAGWSHRRTAYAEYVLMVASGVAAIVASRSGPAMTFFVLALLAASYVTAMLAVDRRRPPTATS